MNHYGAPPSVIPLGSAAEAASMTRDQLITALGSKVVVVGPNKLACTPAALEAVSPGASAGLQTFNPATDNGSVDCSCQW